MACGECRFNLIEDNIIYNAGITAWDHGIYISQGGENITLRRNIWWRISGGAIHIYSGSGIDSPRNIVIEDNIIGPDKVGRCFPLDRRTSTGIYIWGGRRWAGYHRIVRNIIFGGHHQGISNHSCNFNLIANNTILDCQDYTIRMSAAMGNMVVNNIFGAGAQYGFNCWWPHLTLSDHNIYLAGQQRWVLGPHDPEPDTEKWLTGQEPMALKMKSLDAVRRAHSGFDTHSIIAREEDPFMDRANLDFRLRPGSSPVDAGIAMPHVANKIQGVAPDAGALELGEEKHGANGDRPQIPKWLLEKWTISKNR